jgi:hypothetical protein
VQSPGGLAIGSSAATEQGGSRPKAIANRTNHSSPNPAMELSNAPGRSGLVSLLYNELGRQTLLSLKEKFIQAAKMEHIRMTCFVDGSLPDVAETRLQVSEICTYFPTHITYANNERVEHTAVSSEMYCIRHEQILCST